MSDLPPSQPDPPQDERIDSRLSAFLRQAGPVIAAERGLNEVARVKLRSIAADMSLPAEMFEQAIRTLQNQPPVVKRELDRYEAAFEKSMRLKMQSIPRGILTAKIETRAVQVGTEKYQLTELQSREILRLLVGELKLQRISVTQSERHMEATIEDLIGEQTYASESTRQRLIDFGNGLGLQNDHVEAMIRHYVDLNLLSQKKEGNFVKLVTFVLGLAVLVAAGLIAWSLTSENEDSSSAIVDVVDPADEVEPQIVRAPFWNDELQIEAMHVSRIKSEFAPVHSQIASEDIETRIAGYRGLVKVLPELTGNEKMRDHTGAMLRGLIRQEPDDDAVRVLLRELGNATGITSEQLPIDAKFLQRAQWLLSELVAISRESETSKPSGDTVPEGMLRSGMVSEELFHLTGLEQVSGSRVRVQHEFRKKLIENQLQKIKSLVADEPSKAISSFKVMFKESNGLLRDTQRIAIAVDFLQQAVEPAAENWQALESVMEWTVVGSQPEQLVRLISLYEQLTNEAAQRYLGGLLVEQIGMPDSVEPAEVAAFFRRSLGIAEPPALTIQKKRNEFVTNARQLRLSIDPEASEDDALAADIARVAWWNTYASHLRRGDIESPEFQELEKLGPPGKTLESYWTETEGEDDDPPINKGIVARGGVGQDLGRIERALSYVSSSSKSIVKRKDELRRIQQLGSGVQNPPLDRAAGFAKYLLSNRSDFEEQRLAIIALKSAAHWPALLTAVADYLPESELSNKELLEVLEVLIEVPGIDRDDEVWINSIRVALLTKAEARYAAMSGEKEVDTDLTYNHLQEIYYRLIRQRAINFGVSPAMLTAKVSNENTSSGAVLEAWYKHLANNPGDISGMRKLESVDFISENSLQTVVLYQQLLIEELKQKSFARRSWSRTDTMQRLNELELNRTEAGNAFQQMLCNELLLLELMLAEAQRK